MSDPKYITDLRISLGNDKSPLDHGFLKIDPDLNKGAGGEYIYLWYKRSNDVAAAITGLFVCDDEQPNPPLLYFHVPGKDGRKVDLNKGSGGKYIWLTYTKDRDAGKPLIDIAIAESDAPTPEFEKLNYDLNKGAGGKYIYVYFRRAVD